jgi:LemA protein
MSVWLVVLIIVVVLVVLAIGIYNRLVALRQNCNQAFADVDVQLRQRHDLIPNLVETVKGYAAHESGTLEAVVQARNAAVSAEKTGDPKTMGQAEGALGVALGRLIALSEAYPDLKANQNFIKLQDELSDIENKLAASRRFFNSAVGEYNTGREQFPAVVLAGMFGFGPRVFFDLGDQDRATMNEAPQVKFS